MSISEFEFACGIDNQNLAKLGIYIQQSNIVHKVQCNHHISMAKGQSLEPHFFSSHHIHKIVRYNPPR